MPGCLIEKGNESKIEQSMNLDTLQAPIYVGQKVGEINYFLDGEKLATVNLVAKSDIDSISIFTMFKSIIYKWINLLR